MAVRSFSREVLYGLHPVLAALTAGRRTVNRVFTVSSEQQNRRQRRIVDLAVRRGIPVETVPGEQIEKRAGSAAHQGMAAEAGSYPLASLDDMLASVKPEKDPFILIADGVVDPHNLGALARTAACVGIDGLIVPRDNAAGPTPAVSKASAGAIEILSLARVTNISRTIDRLKESGLWTVGLDSGADKTLYETDLSGPLALVVGGEEKGIRRLVKEHCDFMVAIPQTTSVDSLNVSVAGGVAMYEIFRQRQIHF